MLICAFVFASAKIRFSHDAAHMCALMHDVMWHSISSLLTVNSIYNSCLKYQPCLDKCTLQLFSSLKTIELLHGFINWRHKSNIVRKPIFANANNKSAK